VSVELVQRYLPAPVRVDFEELGEEPVDVINGKMELLEVQHCAVILAWDCVVGDEDEGGFVVDVTGATGELLENVATHWEGRKGSEGKGREGKGREGEGNRRRGRGGNEGDWEREGGGKI